LENIIDWIKSFNNIYETEKMIRDILMSLDDNYISGGMIPFPTALPILKMAFSPNNAKRTLRRQLQVGYRVHFNVKGYYDDVFLPLLEERLWSTDGNNKFFPPHIPFVHLFDPIDTNTYEDSKGVEIEGARKTGVSPVLNTIYIGVDFFHQFVNQSSDWDGLGAKLSLYQSKTLDPSNDIFVWNRTTSPRWTVYNEQRDDLSWDSYDGNIHSNPTRGFEVRLQEVAAAFQTQRPEVSIVDCLRHLAQQEHKGTPMISVSELNRSWNKLSKTKTTFLNIQELVEKSQSHQLMLKSQNISNRMLKTHTRLFYFN
jgi:hypothetical protein